MQHTKTDKYYFIAFQVKTHCSYPLFLFLQEDNENWVNWEHWDREGTDLLKSEQGKRRGERNT